MTVVAERPQPGLGQRFSALPGRARWWLAAPTIVAVLSALAFLIVRPDVNDLWAARARATAVSHGVGLTYWFSWFSGGSTPGSYSILTPWLSALITAELLCALAAVAVTVLVSVALRGTAHPVAGAAVATVTAGCNLWSGRVPFLLGSAIAVGAVIAVRHQRRGYSAALAVLSIFASPVSGAFLAMGLSGVFLSRPDYRRTSVVTIIACALGMVAVGLVFGAPGPEPFSLTLVAEAIGVLLAMLCVARPGHLRSTVVLSFVVLAVVALVPNGLGGNFGRFIWFWLPVAVVALGTRRLRVLVLAITPALAVGLSGMVVDLHNAAKPISADRYYTSLAHQLDLLPDLRDYRVEVVNHGSHAAYDALLGHAALARGWETQEDNALNGALQHKTLDAVAYKIWLDNNAVGYVALPAQKVTDDPEYALVSAHRPNYLRLIWHTRQWKLFQVRDATPIAAPPASVLANSQSAMTLQVPCRCEVKLRVRWSKFLTARQVHQGVQASVADDAAGWTVLTVPKPGVYVLRGSLFPR
jgi:hypothetical protein